MSVDDNVSQADQGRDVDLQRDLHTIGPHLPRTKLQVSRVSWLKGREHASWTNDEDRLESKAVMR